MTKRSSDRRCKQIVNKRSDVSLLAPPFGSDPNNDCAWFGHLFLDYDLGLWPIVGRLRGYDGAPSMAPYLCRVLAPAAGPAASV